MNSTSPIRPKAGFGPRQFACWCLVLLATGAGGAQSVELENVLDAFSGDWEGEVEVRALDGVLLKTLPIERSYRWEDDLQVVTTRLMDGDKAYDIEALQSVRLGRLHSVVNRPSAAQEDYAGRVQGGGIEWRNERRNDRDFKERVVIERGVPNLEFSSVAPIRFSGIMGLVRLEATLRPQDGRVQLGSGSRAEVAKLNARINELETELALAQSAPAGASMTRPESAADGAGGAASTRAAEADVRELSLRVRELEQEREELREKLAEAAMLDWTTDALKQARAEADREFEALRLDLAESQRQAWEARREMDSAQAELETIREELAEARTAREGATSTSRTDEQAARIEQLLREADELRVQVAEATALVEQTRRELEAADAAQARQRTELETARAQAAEARHEVADLQQRLESQDAASAAEDRAAALEQDLVTMRAEAQSAHSRVEALTREIAELKEDLERTGAGWERDRKKVEQLNADLSDAVAQVEDLESRLAAAATEEHTATEAITAQQAELRARVAGLAEELEKTRSERDEIAARLTAAEAEAIRLSDQTRELEAATSAATALRQRVNAQENELEASSARIDELRQERDSLTARVDELESEAVAMAGEREQLSREADRRLARSEAERQAAVARAEEVEERLRAAETAEREADRLATGLQRDLEAARGAATELTAARARIEELTSSVGQLEARLERVTAARDSARQDAAMLAEARSELAALKTDLETQRRLAVQRQGDNENLVRRNERLIQERDELAARVAAAEESAGALPPASGVDTDGSVSRQLLDRVEELDRRAIELESERNTLRENNRLLESQLAEARALRDDTLARFQDVVSQLNAMREERDRLARANVALQSDLRAVRQEEPTVVTAAAEPERGVFSRLMSAIGGDDVPRTPDTVIASLEVIGITHSESEDKVILNGRLYRNGDTVDSEFGLVFQRVDGDALVFTDRRGREYRRRF